MAGQKILKSIMARGCGMPITIIICIDREHAIIADGNFPMHSLATIDCAHRQGAFICLLASRKKISYIKHFFFSTYDRHDYDLHGNTI